jgi:hypothetical protein
MQQSDSEFWVLQRRLGRICKMQGMQICLFFADEGVTAQKLFEIKKKKTPK